MDNDNIVIKKKYFYLFRLLNLFISVIMVTLLLVTYISINTNLKNVNKFVDNGITFFDKSNIIFDKINNNLDNSFLLFDTTLINLNRTIYKVEPFLSILSPQDIYTIITNFNDSIEIIKYDTVSVMNNLNNTINNYKINQMYIRNINPTLGIN